MVVVTEVVAEVVGESVAEEVAEEVRGDVTGEVAGEVAGEVFKSHGRVTMRASNTSRGHLLSVRREAWQ